MSVGSLGMAFRTSFLSFQSSFSVISCWSVVSKKNGTSYAMTVDSKFSSIGFVGMSSLNFKMIFSLGSILNEIKKCAAVFVFPEICAIVKLNCLTKSQAFLKCGGIIFVRKNLVILVCYRS